MCRAKFPLSNHPCATHLCRLEELAGSSKPPKTPFICKGVSTLPGFRKPRLRVRLTTYSQTNLDSILTSRDITLSTKVRLVKAMVYPVVMYGCESWTIKRAECRKIDAFELCCWRRLLRVPWTARRSNQSILKEISPGCSLGGLMLKLKLQYFSHLMRRADSFEKTLILRKIEGRRRRGRQRMRWMDGHHRLDGHGFGWTLEVGDGQGGLVCCGSWGHKESDTTERLN